MSLNIEPISSARKSRISRAQVVAERVSRMIIGGDPSPGERLGTKDELRTMFNVATGTLNEAIRLLETRGLVEARPGPRGGIFVAQPSAHVRLGHLILELETDAQSIADGLEIRDALETPIALHAARHAQADDIRLMRGMVAEMGECDHDPTKYLMLNWSLHEAIAGLAVNGLLRTIYLAALDTAREGVHLVLPDEDYEATWRNNWQLHVDLVEAIASRDMTAVIGAARAHRPLAARG